VGAVRRRDSAPERALALTDVAAGRAAHQRGLLPSVTPPHISKLQASYRPTVRQGAPHRANSMVVPTSAHSQRPCLPPTRTCSTRHQRVGLPKKIARPAVAVPTNRPGTVQSPSPIAPLALRERAFG
jgi:hypothetical protein